MSQDLEPVKPVCRCGRPLVENLSTGKFFVRCPACRKREQDVQKASHHRIGGLKGIRRF